jgi:hypothetical protein
MVAARRRNSTHHCGPQLLPRLQRLPPSSTPSPPLLIFGGWRRIQGKSPKAAARRTGRKGWALLVGRRLGFGDARVGGWDSVQGRVEAIRDTSTAGRGPSWLASAMGPARLAPARVTVGKKERQGKRDKVADGWGPHVSGCGGLAGQLVMVG